MVGWPCCTHLEYTTHKLLQWTLASKIYTHLGRAWTNTKKWQRGNANSVNCLYNPLSTYLKPIWLKSPKRGSNPKCKETCISICVILPMMSCECNSLAFLHHLNFHDAILKNKKYQQSIYKISMWLLAIDVSLGRLHSLACSNEETSSLLKLLAHQCFFNEKEPFSIY